jgi:hypothetical protein
MLGFHGSDWLGFLGLIMSGIVRFLGENERASRADSRMDNAENSRLEGSAYPTKL